MSYRFEVLPELYLWLRGHQAGALGQNTDSQFAVGSIDLRKILAYQPVPQKGGYDELRDSIEKLMSFSEIRWKNENDAQLVNFYIEPDVTGSLGAKTRFQLKDLKDDFLNDSQRKVLYLLGNAGTGKSCYCLKLEQLLRDQYRANTAEEGKIWIPIHIRLGDYRTEDVGKCVEDYFEKAFKAAGIKNEVLPRLKLERDIKFVFILDGRDEIKGGYKGDVYKDNELFNWQAKVIITSRIIEARESFDCMGTGSGQSGNSLLRYFLPFNKEQIYFFIEKYFSGNNEKIASYRKLLDDNHELRKLAGNPFILKILMGIDLASLKTQDLRKITRSQVYKIFIEGWFEKSKKRWSTQHNDYSEDELIEGFLGFSKKLAFKMYEQGARVIEYAPLPKKNKWISSTTNSDLTLTHKIWDDFFTLTDKDTQQARSGCPLKKVDNNQYKFIHKSIMEYFVSRQLLDVLGDKDNEIIYWGSVRHVKEEPGIIAFLVEQLSDMHPTQLELLVVHSQKAQSAETIRMASHAVTVLGHANRFQTRKEWDGVQIPHADLSGVYLTGSKLRGADLTGVNLRAANLSNVDLTGALLGDIDLGELPYLLHKTSVTCMTYVNSAHSFEVEVLATGDEHGQIYIWVIGSSNPPELLEKKHQCSISALHSSPDGQFLLSATGKEEFVILWRVSNRQIYHCLNHESFVLMIEVNFEKNLLASACFDKTIRIWNLQNGTQIKSLDTNTFFISCLHFNFDGTLLGAGADAEGYKNHAITLWGINSDQNNKKLLQEQDNKVTCFQFSQKHQIMASGSESGEIRVWDLTSNNFHILTGHKEKVTHVLFVSDDDLLASVSEDRTLRLWNLHSRTSRILGKANFSPWTNICFNKNLQLLASSHIDYTARLWDVKTGAQQSLFVGHKGGISCLKFNPTSQYLASSSYDATVRFWKVKIGKGTMRCASETHESQIYPPCFGPNGNLVSMDFNKTIKLWNAETGFVKKIWKYDMAIAKVSFSDDGHLMALGGQNGLVQLRDLDNNFIHDFYTKDEGEGPITCLQFNPDGSMLAITSLFGKLYLQDIKNRQTTAFDLRFPINSIRFSPDGSLMAFGDADGSLSFCNMSSKQVNKVFNSLGSILCMNFSPDGNFLAIGTTMRLYVWDFRYKSMNELVFGGDPENVGCVCFNADSNLLSLGNDAGTFRLWSEKNAKWEFFGRYVFNGRIDALTKEGFLACSDTDSFNFRIWRHNWSNNAPLLLWGTDVALDCKGTIISETQGLSDRNRELMLQHGAETPPQPDPNAEQLTSFYKTHTQQLPHPKSKHEKERNSKRCSPF